MTYTGPESAKAEKEDKWKISFLCLLFDDYGIICLMCRINLLCRFMFYNFDSVGLLCVCVFYGVPDYAGVSSEAVRDLPLLHFKSDAASAAKTLDKCAEEAFRVQIFYASHLKWACRSNIIQSKPPARTGLFQRSFEK